jgi:hypothetical protein
LISGSGSKVSRFENSCKVSRSGRLCDFRKASPETRGVSAGPRRSVFIHQPRRVPRRVSLCNGVNFPENEYASFAVYLLQIPENFIRERRNKASPGRDIEVGPRHARGAPKLVPATGSRRAAATPSSLPSGAALCRGTGRGRGHLPASFGRRGKGAQSCDPLVTATVIEPSRSLHRNNPRLPRQRSALDA